MPIVSRQLSLSLEGNTQILNITHPAGVEIAQSGLYSGILTIFVQHTTASVLIIEDEPGLRADTKTLWDRLIPNDPTWQHNTRNPGENNGHSHLRGQIQGQSLTIPFKDQRLLLGRWQEIVIIDFDTTSRTRQVIFQILGE